MIGTGAGEERTARKRGGMRMLGAVAAVLGTTALAVPGCGGRTETSRSDSPVPLVRADTVVVEGFLTRELVRCAALRDPAGGVFALEDIPPPFDDWRRFVDERFLVVGEEVGSGRCGNAQTLRVIDMGLVLPPVLGADPGRSNG